MRRVLLAALLLLSASCSKPRGPARGPIVVLRFENLTGEAARDWIERGAARQIAAQLGAAVADSAQPSAERERAIASGNTRILHGYVSRSGGRLRLHADLEDAATASFRASEAAGDDGVIALIHALARQIDSHARPLGARNEDALAAYAAGLEAGGGGAALFSDAIASDPNYGAAYVALVELSIARQDRAAAERTLAMARARGDAIPPSDRARLDVIAAQLSGNPGAVADAVTRAAQLTPANANVLRAVANSQLAAKRFDLSVEYFKKALALEPRDPAALNSLGYTYAYAGDLDSALKTLGEYERARPQDANPLDSMAEVNFYYGRFGDAEKHWLRTYEKDPAFFNSAPLMKAAIAHLLAGDATGAESIFARYEAVQRTAADPAIELNRARWDAFRGKRTEAIRRMETVTGPLADCTLAVWLLEAGDRAAAARHTACRFLTDPAGPFPTPLARAYAYLLAKNFEAAAPLLRDIAARAAPNPSESTPVMLAWALVETGKFDEAEKYLSYNPVPTAPAADPFESLVYPRIFRLREMVAAKKK